MEQRLCMSLCMMFFWLFCGVRAVAAEADQALQVIQDDLNAGRLDQPLRHNAMHRIEAFRSQWPYDYRVLPLAYQWGESMWAQAQNRLAQQDYKQTRQILERIWLLVPLTPGLDALQQQLDRLSPAVAATALPAVAVQPILMPDYVAMDDQIHRQFRNPDEDNSPPLARLSLPVDAVSDRDVDIEERLKPLCRLAIDQGASAIIHAEDRVDYYWLTVRLTLCIRRLDRGFRLRHSFRQADGSPIISLHPARDLGSSITRR